MTRPGRVIVLNGTTSAGKSTLAAALQAQLGALGRCWIVLGIDDFLGKLPAAWVGFFEHGAHADDGIRFERVGAEVTLHLGPVGRALLGGYRDAVVAVARRGMDVIVDEVVLDEDAWGQWEEGFAGLDVLWVGVECPLEVCEQRERARRDRMTGQARSQAAFVHRFPRYDLVVDTSSSTPAELGARVIEAHRQRPPQ
jgi:chloramphenicol 3-O phosphotransferase